MAAKRNYEPERYYDEERYYPRPRHDWAASIIALSMIVAVIAFGIFLFYPDLPFPQWAEA